MKKQLTHFNIFGLCKGTSMILLFVSLLGIVLDMIVRRYSGILLDELNKNIEISYFFGVFFGICSVLILTKYFVPLLMEHFNGQFTGEMYQLLNYKALSAKQVQLDNINIGEASTLFTSDINGVVNYAKRMLNVFIPDIFTFIGSIILIIEFNVWLGIATIISAVIPAVIMFWTSNALTEGNMRYQETLQNINKEVANSFYNIEFIKANDINEELKIENESMLNTLHNIRKKLAGREAMVSAPALLSSFCTFLVIAILGGYLVLEDSISGGDLFAAILLSDYIVSPVMRFDNSIKQFRRATVNLKRINKYLHMKSEEPFIPHFHYSQQLRFSNVSFGYNSNVLVLSSLNISWKKGKLNCIIGDNGAGKTTIMKLLSGIYDIQSGSIEVPSIVSREITKRNSNSNTGVYFI